MGLRYQRRINLGAGWGFNLSLRGVSPSYRSKWGSISPNGFSLRTGIPGLTYRSSRRSKDSGIFELIFLILFLAIDIGFAILFFLVRIIFLYIVPALVQIVLWVLYFINDSLKSEKPSNYLGNVDDILAPYQFTEENGNKATQNSVIEVATSGLVELNLYQTQDRNSIRFKSGRLYECIKIFAEFLKSTNESEELKSSYKEANMSSYGHLLERETVDDHIIYSDIYKLLSLLDLPDEADAIFIQLVGGILNSNLNITVDSECCSIEGYKLLNSCKLNNEIIQGGSFLNSSVFAYLDKKNRTFFYSDASECFNYFAYSLEGEKADKWCKQVRFIVMSPEEVYDKEKIENIF